MVVMRTVWYSMSMSMSTVLESGGLDYEDSDYDNNPVEHSETTTTTTMTTMNTKMRTTTTTVRTTTTR